MPAHDQLCSELRKLLCEFFVVCVGRSLCAKQHQTKIVEHSTTLKSSFSMVVEFFVQQMGDAKFNEQNHHPFKFEAMKHCQSLGNNIFNLPFTCPDEFLFQPFSSCELFCCTTGDPCHIALADVVSPHSTFTARTSSGQKAGTMALARVTAETVAMVSFNKTRGDFDPTCVETSSGVSTEN